MVKPWPATKCVVICIVAASAATCQYGQNSPLDTKCRDLATNRIEQLKRDSPNDFLNLKTDSFYSRVLGTCIFTEVPETGTSTLEYDILDLSRSFLKDTSVILHCDKDGADSVIVDKVRNFDGYTFTVAYSEWLDDGFGGPPRTLKTPAKPYTSKECEAVYQKWINFLKD